MNDEPMPKSPPVIMVVEDDKDTREILCVVIQRKFNGATICTANNGREGVELFKKQGADIVITDVNMPEMGGVEMVQAIRHLSPDVKVIVLTADTGKDALDASIQRGFQLVHFILKPVAYQSLFLAIDKCLAEIASDSI